MTNPFQLPGRFLKGNLHAHTTNSDGRLRPQELVDLYRQAGYDFLAITDHNHLTSSDGLFAEGLTLLPGMELHQGKGQLGQVHHIVAIGMQTAIQVPQTDCLGEVMEYICQRSPLAFIAHPYWTSLSLGDILGLGYGVGIEVFNTTCQRGIGRGDSGVHWDELLARGERTLGFAVDDTHMHYDDALGGWVMVKAPNTNAETIIEALIAGHFYSSSGPSIEDVQFEEGRVTVRCSPCQAVHLISPWPGCGVTSYSAGYSGVLTEVTLPFAAEWHPVRIECVDERGNKAWTNPFWTQ